MKKLRNYLMENISEVTNWKPSRFNSVQTLDLGTTDIQISWQSGDVWKIRIGKYSMKTLPDVSLENAKKIAAKEAVKILQNDIKILRQVK